MSTQSDLDRAIKAYEDAKGLKSGYAATSFNKLSRANHKKLAEEHPVKRHDFPYFQVAVLLAAGVFALVATIKETGLL